MIAAHRTARRISTVFRHPHKRDLFIAVGDRWLPDIPAEESEQGA